MTSEPLLAQLRQLLAESNTPAYVVGGYVRDRLLGRESHDIDIAVERDAARLAFRLADRLGLPAYVLDAERDIGRIILPNSQTTLDVARFRGPTLADDLRGRDFTINALAWPAADEHPTIIDFHGGVDDLSAGVIRAIHSRSIADDPVRALRAVRFACQLGFQLSDDTATAVRAAAPSLPARTSPERIREELNRLLTTDVPDQAVAMMARLSLLDAVLPEIAALAGVEQSQPHHEAVLPHTLSVLRYLVEVERLIDGMPLAAEWAESLNAVIQPYRLGLAAYAAEMVDGSYNGRMLLRWAALLHDVGKATTQMVDETGRIRFIGHDEVGARIVQARLGHLNFGNEATRRVRDVVAGHMRPLFLAAEGQRPSRRAVYRFFRALHAAGLDVVVLAAADHLATYNGRYEAGSWERLLVVLQTLLENYFTAFTETVVPVRLLNGRDIMDLLNIGPGRELGRLLASLEEAQAAGEVTTRSEAIDFLRRSQ